MRTGNNEIRKMQRRLCGFALFFVFLLAVVFMIAGERPIAKGLVLGTCFSVLNFLLLGESIPLTLGRSRAKAGLVGLFSIFSRFMVLAIPMVVAIKSISFDFFAVVVGIFAVQIVAMLDYLVIRAVTDRMQAFKTRKKWKILP